MVLYFTAELRKQTVRFPVWEKYVISRLFWWQNVSLIWPGGWPEDYRANKTDKLFSKIIAEFAALIPDYEVTSISFFNVLNSQLEKFSIRVERSPPGRVPEIYPMHCFTSALRRLMKYWTEPKVILIFLSKIGSLDDDVITQVANHSSDLNLVNKW